MQINKLMFLGAILAAMMFAGSVIAANPEKPAAKATTEVQQDKDMPKIPKAEHEKLYPHGHDNPLPGRRCWYDEKEGMYYCNY